MKIRIDRESCALHGHCTFAAPAVFDFDDNGDLQITEHPDEPDRDAVWTAVDMCPEQALTLEP